MKRTTTVLSFAAAVLAGFSAGALADTTRGTIQIVGHGEDSAAPDCATLAVTVTSICFDTAKEAMDANAKLANQLIHTLQTFTNDPHDQVTASGGPTMRQTEYSYEGTQPKVLCQNKWHVSNQLVLTESTLASLPDIQDHLVAAIDSFPQTIDATKYAQTYAELSQPSFELYPATLKKLRASAQNAAWDDAKTQYQTFADRCAFDDVHLERIEQPQFSTTPRYGQQMNAPVGGSITPIIPKNIKVTADWEFTWSFRPKGTCSLY